jgi:hypothetical protein
VVAALYKGSSGKAERGTLTGSSWNKLGDLVTTNNTIDVLEGELIQ